MSGDEESKGRSGKSELKSGSDLSKKEEEREAAARQEERGTRGKKEVEVLDDNDDTQWGKTREIGKRKREGREASRSGRCEESE